MKKILLLAAGTLIVPATLPAQVTEVSEDFSGTLDSAFGSVTIAPPEDTTGDVSNIVGFDYVNNTSNPSLTQAPDGNGSGLLLSTNQDTTEAAQIAFYTIGNDTDEDYAVEAMQAPYVSDDAAGGNTTTWGGIGIRVTGENDITGSMATTGNFGSGYFIQVRTDASGSFGSYVNFYKFDAGTDDFLGRYYFEVGTGGISDGSLTGDNASKIIRDPEEPATNTWVPVRLEASGSNIKLFVDDLQTPIVDWDDPDPITAGKALVFHEDPFSSQTDPPETVATIFDRVEVQNLATSVNNWTFYH